MVLAIKLNRKTETNSSSFKHLPFTGVDVPMPYAKTLEAAALPQTHDVVTAVNKVLGIK